MTVIKHLCFYVLPLQHQPNALINFRLKISILSNYCRYSFVIASVGFIIDRVTTQHTPKCVKKCSDNKVSYNCLTNFYQFLYKLGYNFENSVFFQRRLIILL